MIELQGVYNPTLVYLSIVIAVLCSFIALSLVTKIADSDSAYQRYWLWSGSITLGMGIWSMHFIGMLAYRLPLSMGYDPWLTLLSLLTAVGASFVALFLATRKRQQSYSLIVSSLFMGSGIAGMHYLGMMAMISEASMHYRPLLVATSVLVAGLASFFALKLSCYLRKDLSRPRVSVKLLGAMLMGLAISGMHYIGMAAVRFRFDAVLHQADASLPATSAIDSEWLSIVIGSLVMLILGGMFFALFVNKQVTQWVLGSNNFLVKNFLIISVLIYVVVYLLLEDAEHVMQDGIGSLGQGLAALDSRQIMVQLIIVVAALGFGFFTQRLFWIARKMNSELIQVRDKLLINVADGTAALSDSEQRVRSVLDTAYDAFVAINSKGRIIDWNLAATRMYGLDPSEAIGRQIDELLFPDAGSPVARLIANLGSTDVSHSKQQRFECISQGKDGRALSIEGGLTALQLGNGVVFNIFMRDITQRKQTELAIRQAKEIAEQANAMKSEFLANMSHELRTPLNAIMGFSEVLKDGMVGELSPEQSDYVGEIYDSSTHLLSLINDILDLSKVEAGKMELELNEVDLASLLSNSLCIIRERASSHRIQLESHIEEDIGSVLLDERKFKQIVYNLLSNAVKFTPDGGTVTLNAGIGNGQLKVAVIDTGIGIEQKDLDRLFTPFGQLDGSATRTHQGTGLGLSLVKSLTEMHQGVVSVSSRPGEGSCFTLLLPLKRSLELAVADERSPMKGLNTSLSVVD